MNISDKVNAGVRSIKPYVPGRSVQEIIRAGQQADVVKMASNENPLGASPAALEAVRTTVPSVYQYPEVSCPDLRSTLGARLGISEDELIVCNGADGVIYALGMCLIAAGDECIIPQITFPLYETVVRIMGGRVVTSPMRGYAIDLEEVLKRITRKTKLIWLCNPNNPTGTLACADELEPFLAEVPDDVFVVHDEVYADFAPTDSFPDTVRLIREGRENLFLIRSFSKIYGLAGLRIGYGVGAEELIRWMYRVRPPFDVSVVAQAAAVAAIQDRSFYTKTLEVTAGGKEYLYRNLEALGFEYVPSHTNFILIRVGMDETLLCDRLVEEGVIARPAGGYQLPRHIRLTVGLPHQNQRLIEALKRICEQRDDFESS